MKKVLVVDDMQQVLEFHKGNILYNNKDVKVDTAQSAREGYDKVFAHVSDPYDVIITDLQMENDFDPLCAGEWLIQQIQLLKQYYKTRIYICSGYYAIKMIAEKYNVDYVRKSELTPDSDFYKDIDLL